MRLVACLLRGQCHLVPIPHRLSESPPWPYPSSLFNQPPHPPRPHPSSPLTHQPLLSSPPPRSSAAPATFAAPSAGGSRPPWPSSRLVYLPSTCPSTCARPIWRTGATGRPWHWRVGRSASRRKRWRRTRRATSHTTSTRCLVRRDCIGHVFVKPSPLLLGEVCWVSV